MKVTNLAAIGLLVPYASAMIGRSPSPGRPSSARTASISDFQVDLPSGVSAQVYASLPDKPTQPTLAFVHGSFHAGWCWTENFFPFFTALGYPCVALSLRGTGGTFAGEGVRKVKMGEHVEDLKGFLDEIPAIVGRQEVEKKPPIVLSHSFGGLVVMKYMESYANHTPIGGLVTMCSVPPSGNGKLTMRYLRRSLVDSWKVTSGLAMKKCITNVALCRELFFSNNGVSDEEIERFQKYFERDTTATIDMLDVAKNFPAKKAVDGRAPFLASAPPALVIGGIEDFIVDREGVEETARFFGLDQPLMIDSPHDVMLGRRWKNTAEAIHNWIQENIS